MNTDRYSHTDVFNNKIKIFSNRLNKQYNIKKTAYDNLLAQYKEFLKNYDIITNLKWQNLETKAQLKNYENEKINFDIELAILKEDLDKVEKEYLFYYEKEYSKSFEGYESKGFLDRNFIKTLLDGTEEKGYILKGMAYRPDKVSMFYYKTQFLHWVITLVNDFFGIQDYTEGKEIKIPSLRTITEVLG